MSKHNKKVAGITSILSNSNIGTQELTELERNSRFNRFRSGWKKNLLYPLGGLALLFLIGTGVMAKNGWLPATDAMTGKKTGWFGKALPANASSSWNPLANPLPTPTPQLSKEYIYAGSRLLAVEDANASAAPPADLAVWRPGTGYWYVLGGSGSQQVFVPWGQAGDRTVPGDYDGDGKTDFSVFRPSGTSSPGTWYVQRSTDAGLTAYNFGADTDLMAPADYDGDGKTDAAVYRPNTPPGNATWYVQRSSDSTVGYYQFGLSSDKAAPADYDGDGKADIAVFRPGDLFFYIQRSSDGTLQYAQVGASSTDVPVPADYDGDGKADMAVKSGNVWKIMSSITGQITNTTWEQAGDKPVQNDYDGDGKVDIAVWRESNGYWYIRNSANLSTRTVQWGTTGDIPVPSFYRR